MATDTRQLFTGRRVLVTGAAGAFGSATSAALRERGAAVAGLDVVSGDPASHDGVHHCDVTDDEQVPVRVAEVVEQLGGLDALVHFAGVGEPVDAGAPPGPTARRTLDINLLGPWRVTAGALPELTSTGGRVVFVASELAYATLPFAAAYAASKRGLAAYADALRLEYGTQVAVTTVYPGYVRTPIHDASLAAGLSMEGQVRAERVDDVVGTVLGVLTARRPPRDTAATRLGGIELWAARRLPATVDLAVRLRVGREMRRGRYADAPLARGLARRYGVGEKDESRDGGSLLELPTQPSQGGHTDGSD